MAGSKFCRTHGRDSGSHNTRRSVLEGQVTRTAPFGAFVQLEPELRALCIYRKVSDRHISKPEEAVNSGDRLKREGC